jgi:Ca2+-binding EF-hand superfamily protein
MDANGDGSVSQEEFAQAGRQFGKRPPGAPGTPPPGGQPGGPANREEFEALFDRTDSNSDGKLTKDEIPEERRGMRAILERSGSDSLNKEQFVRGMMAGMAQTGGQPPRPEGAPQRPPQGPPGPPPGGGLFGALDTDRNGELSTSEIVGAGSALLKLDRNNDGKLTPDEVFVGGPGGPPGRPGEGRPGEGRPENGRPGLRGLGGINPEEFRQRLKEADANNDGKISKDEAPPILRGAFERLDANSDGFVDETEAREMFRRMADGAGKAKGRPEGDLPRRPDSNNDKK